MSKINIAVCDDDAVFREMFISGINSCAEKYGLDIKLFPYSNGLELLISEIRYNIIFIDYKMGIMNGAETTRKLRHKGLTCPIVLVAEQNDVLHNMNDADFFRVIRKPEYTEQLDAVMEELSGIYRNRNTVAFVSDDKTVSLYSDEILYVSGGLFHSTVHTGEEYYNVKLPFSKLCTLLPQNEFFRSCYGYAVNIGRIRCFGDNGVIMDDGEIVKVSSRKMSLLKSAHENYNKKYFA